MMSKGKSLRPRSVPFNFRHLNELANVGNWATPLVNVEIKASPKRVEAQPELTSLFTTYRRSLNSKVQWWRPHLMAQSYSLPRQPRLESSCLHCSLNVSCCNACPFLLVLYPVENSLFLSSLQEHFTLSLCPLSDVSGVNKRSSFSLSTPATVSRPLVVLTACFWDHATRLTYF